MIILQTNLNPNPNPKKKNCELAMEDNTNNILENEATKRVRKKKRGGGGKNRDLELVR